MKEFRFRLILIVAAIVLCIYLLYPTYVDYQNSGEIKETLQLKKEQLFKENPDLNKSQLDRILQVTEDSILTANPDIVSNREKRVKLGLDLQGGMRVVLEVNTSKLMEKLAKNPDDVFREVLVDAEKEADDTDESVVDVLGRKFSERGVRLSRYYGTIRQDDDEIISELKEDAEDAVTRAMEIIRNRVDQYGVSEPSIQRQGSRRIIVELPGVAREEEAKQLLQGTALLEFRLVKEPDFAFNVMQRIDEVLAGKVIDSTLTDTTGVTEETADTSITSTDTLNKPEEELTEEEFRVQHPFFSTALLDPQGRNADAYVKAEERNKLDMMLSRPEVQKVIPNNVQFIYSAKSFTADEDEEFYLMYMVNKEPELTGGVITDAVATIDQMNSSPIVNMTMNSEGATEWARITGANIDKRIAIVLDGVVYSAPVVQNKIAGGRSQISGMADIQEAQLMEIVLKAGALPAPVDIIEERTVGPSLGEDSVNKGLLSVMLGFALVAAFMIFYYRKAGTIAAAALTFTILFILGILAGFNATLTLPGIAGVILTIGMAVDANVLIFERIREEMSTGKTVKASIDSGYARALSAIVDSNITTFFTGIILYQFGTGPIQGFALTLMIGIAASLFSALVIARVIFDIMVSKNQAVTVG
ncbi:MAG: protein translocase subunit SecD [Ignavibacteria bacterium]|nr:protein translocase subunit SecD [Ignavibacteria bacterium]MBT8382210.1 protein translocase subunit SecD [Ignavibacteria bacterium]MBT8390919.1 protein translocase subunit SecD [Ignavibacteria bacterium]NNJ53932.1 protein translocase subunit SecD [Ignavibacteriaceae bacterium]NNL20585.1 protein translocase subunit SecD [Ignavibacteriaceae bacterium]